MTRFEKVSFEQYKKDTFGGDQQYSLFTDKCGEEYDEIILPKRATRNSAGYDFFSPRTVSIMPGDSCTIYSGIRAIFPNDIFLALYPRSGLGIKYRVTLANSTGIVDSDYSGAANEGHIIFKLVNNGRDPVTIQKGRAFAQGIFQRYYITDDDQAEGDRAGGLGSTDGT